VLSLISQLLCSLTAREQKQSQSAKPSSNPGVLTHILAPNHVSASIGLLCLINVLLKDNHCTVAIWDILQQDILEQNITMPFHISNSPTSIWGKSMFGSEASSTLSLVKSPGLLDRLRLDMKPRLGLCHQVSQCRPGR